MSSRILLLTAIGLALIGTLGITSPFQAEPTQTYWVDAGHPAASDGNAGTESEPWRTIQHAADVLQPGEQVLVKSGVYTELYQGTPNTQVAGIKPQESGTPSAPIIFAAAPGHTPVIDQLGQGTGFYIFKRNHIVIQGFEIRNVEMAGIWTAVDGARDITLLDNNIHDVDGPRGSNTGAIKLDGCQDCTVQRNWLHKVRVGGERELNSAGLHSFDMENTLIADNAISDVHAGVYHKRSSGGPGAQITRNLLRDTNIGVLYSVAGNGDPEHRNALVSENEFVQCGRGIVATVHETAEPSRDLMIRNNAFIDCREGVSLLGVDDVTLLNNIFRVDEAAIVTIGDERRPVRISRSDFNMFDGAVVFISNRFADNESRYQGLRSWRRDMGFDQQSLEEEVEFRATSAEQSWLELSSPALGAGEAGLNIGPHPVEEQVLGPSSFVAPPAPLGLQLSTDWR